MDITVIYIKKFLVYFLYMTSVFKFLIELAEHLFPIKKGIFKRNEANFMRLAQVCETLYRPKSIFDKENRILRQIPLPKKICVSAGSEHWITSTTTSYLKYYTKTPATESIYVISSISRGRDYLD